MKKGFTLIELLVVIAIIGILAAVVLSSLSKSRARAQLARDLATLRNLSNSFELYHIDYGNYPSDVSPDVLPAGMTEYLSTGWPEASFPGAVFDWEYWNPGTVNEAVQLSLRFCEGGNCNFPDQDWADGFVNQSAAYYCMSGSCRPWETDLSGAIPGYCFNC